MSSGSHTTWDGMPRVCSGCGGKLSMRADTLWLDTHQHESWHFACKHAAHQARTTNEP
jgi:hypothetical protein